MLLLLHMGIWWDFGGWVSRSLLLAHLGLFLIWQPFWDRNLPVRFVGGAIILFVAFLFLIQLNWLLITFWTLLLVGLVAGRASSLRGRARLAYLSALIFLVSEVLVSCVPSTANIAPFLADMREPIQYGFLLLPMGLLFVGGQSSFQINPGSVDFVIGLAMSLLTMMLALGALTFHFVSQVPYLSSLVLTLIGIGVFLLTISWLWQPLIRLQRTRAALGPAHSKRRIAT